MLVSWRTEIMAQKITSVSELPLNIIKNRPDAQSIVQGVTDRSAKGNALPFYNRQDPALLEEWFDDFHYFNSSKYLITKVEAGSGSATQVVSGSTLTLTNDNGASDFTAIQPQVGDNTNVANFINPVNEKGSDIFFRCRVRFPNVNNTKFYLGLFDKCTAAYPSFGSFVSHMVFSWKPFGSPATIYQYGKDNTSNIFTSTPGRLINPKSANEISVADSYTVPYPANGSVQPFSAFPLSNEGTAAASGLPVSDPEYPRLNNNDFLRFSMIYKAGDHKAPNGQDSNGRLEYWVGRDGFQDQCVMVIYPNLSDVTSITGLTPTIIVGNSGATSSCEIDYMHAGQFRNVNRVGQGE